MNRLTRSLSLSAVALGLACGSDELTDPTSVSAPGGSVAYSIGVGTSGETIATDKDDYAPGQTVTMTGTGWEPGEAVRLYMVEEPEIHGPREWDVQADTAGNFTDSSFSPEEHHLGVTFTLTATGLSSGRSAQTIFTDNPRFWHGCVNTDWHTAGNWRGNASPLCNPGTGTQTVPTLDDDVTIVNVTNKPVVNAAAVAKSLTISSGAQLTINANLTLANDVNVAGTWTHTAGAVSFNASGKKIIVGGTYNQSGGTFGTLNANRPDFLMGSTGTGTQTGGTLNLNNFEIASGRTFTQAGSSLVALVKDWKTFGTFTSTGGKVQFATISGSSAVWASTGTNQFFDVEFDVPVTLNAQTISVGGDWINDASGNLAGSNNHTVVFNGGGNQTIGGTTSTTFRNLTVNKSGGKLELAQNQTVGTGSGGALTLTQGNITTNAKVFIVASAGSVSRTDGHVVGNLQRTIPAANPSAVVYDIGTDLAYTPLTIDVDGVGGTAGGLIGSAFGVAHANIGTIDLASHVSRYWKLTPAGAALGGRTYKLQLQFVDGEAGDPNDASEIRRFDGANWQMPVAVAPAATPVYVRNPVSTQVNGFNAFSDFVVGRPSAGPTKLAFSSSAFTGVVGECLGPITVQTQNASSAPTNPLSDIAVGLATDGSGTFHSGSTCAGSITSVEIGTGSNSASFYYKATARGDGSHELTASATDLTSASQIQTINKAETSTEVSSSDDESVFSQLVTFTATVSVDAPGSGTPSGNVTFERGGAECGGGTVLSTVALAGGQAEFSTTSLAVGPHLVRACYGGDANFNGSDGSVTQTVEKASTTTGVTSSQNPSVFGQQVTFTATVNEVAPATETPAGNVTFKEGTCDAGTTLASTALNGSGQAAFSSFTLDVSGSPHTITACYAGNANFNGSSGSFQQTVNKASTTTSITSVSPPGSQYVNGQVTVEFSVAVVPPGSGTPSGNVEVKNGSTVLCFAALSATSCDFTPTAVGLLSLVASYVGDDNFETSASAATPYTVKYKFLGFSAPVDRPDILNVSKAGQAIPLKWQLLDANNDPVTNLTAVTIKIGSLACNTNPVTDLIEEYASGASGLQNHGDGYYQFNWKTPTTYANSCRSIGLDFGNGYVEWPLANFNFKK